MIIETLHDLISSNSDVTDIIPSNQIVAGVNLDQKHTEFICLYRTGTVPNDDNDSFGKYGDVSYKILMAHQDYLTLETLQSAVISSLNEFEGTNSGNTIIELRWVDAKDGWSEELDKMIRYLDFEITYKSD